MVPSHQVANTSRAPTGASLSTVQSSTLQWMAWRENGGADEGERRGRSGATKLEETVRGGVLGHLSSEEASTCVLALIQQETLNAAEGRVDR